jgi:hypothetical protein
MQRQKWRGFQILNRWRASPLLFVGFKIFGTHNEPVSDIGTATLADSLRVLDPKRPIREADNFRVRRHVSKVPAV